MAQPAPRALPDPDSGDFDLSRIFIAREQQLDLFNIYLTRWKNLILNANPSVNTSMAIAPSPNNKLQGLLVLLYGHGGFGKSTLLKRYQNRALEEKPPLTVSAIVDWEFAIEGKRTLFNPPPGQEVDAFEYYRMLCGQLALALAKSPTDFRSYQAAVKNVEEARKQASDVLNRMQSDDQYAELRGVTIDMLSTLIGTVAPAPFNTIASNEKMKEIANEGIKIGADLVAQIHAKLRDALGNGLGDYLDAPIRLGAALGRDLNTFAKNFPLLIFFDTYEEIDTADRLLRMVMGTAGMRVGWILAGRDNLWGGSEQRKRSIAKGYGYKDIVSADRGLPIDFNVGGVGAFTLSDIQDYFDQVCNGAHYQPPLPAITEEQAERILEVTQGIPLAVSIAAALYLETASLEQATETLDGQRQIVDQMVERYLLHARDEQSERFKLYGLALLRRADQPLVVAATLGLNEEDAKANYERELSRLHRQYSFIFTEKVQPSLHQEVRHFLRLWLLERRKNPEIIALNTRLKEVHETEIKRLEARRHYATLRERLQDDEWIGVYLDCVEQQFWLDPVEGIQYLLPFMIAAAVYRRDLSKDAAELGTFFAKHLGSPYNHWWIWAVQGLVGPASRGVSDQELARLQNLVQLAEHHPPAFPPFLPDAQMEVEAALWWRVGEALRDKDKRQAFEWFEKALTRLGTQSDLREATAKTALDMSYELWKANGYPESLPFLNRAVDLKPDYILAYHNRGYAYWKLKEYQRAAQNYNQLIELDPNDARAYNGRGTAYEYLKEYQRAIEDYNRALELDPSLAVAYGNRGRAYWKLREYQRAIEDYNRALELDPSFAVAYHNRGYAYWKLKEYQRAIEGYDLAIALDPTYALAYYHRGFAYLWLGNTGQARADYSNSHKYDQPDNNAAWMAEWTTMGKQRIGREVAQRLEVIAALNFDSYVGHVCLGIVLGLQGKLREGLQEIEKAILLNPKEWDAYFWKGMLTLYYYSGQSGIDKAQQAIEQALEVGLPPILLTPLYWLEQDTSEVFSQYARPLLQKYGI